MPIGQIDFTFLTIQVDWLYLKFLTSQNNLQKFRVLFSFFPLEFKFFKQMFRIYTLIKA